MKNIILAAVKNRYSIATAKKHYPGIPLIFIWMQLKSSIKSFNSFIICCVGCQLLLISCAQPVNQPIVEANRKNVSSEIVFYDDSLGARIITDNNLSNVNQLILQAEKPLSIEYLIKALQPNMDDSTLSTIAAITSNEIAPGSTKRSLREIKQKDGAIQFYFKLDTTYIFPLLRKNINVSSQQWVGW